ncbi:MAG: Ig-like domain repeat protein [Acidobacteriota bacterium]|nr:Ig-like domain repeat protein [Acidobacteriota bacterium]
MKTNYKIKMRNKSLRTRALMTTVLAALVAICGLLTTSGVNAALLSLAPIVSQNNSQTYTTDADFAAGTLFNINNNAPNGNQLQLNTQLSTFPTMWIANSSENTVSKIDTDTGKELARYRTHFNSGQPSRTAVDRDGNVYILNRTFNSRPMELFKILASGGIDRNGNGVIDTSSDLNNNNRTTINAAADPNEVLPLIDLNGNNIVDDNEIKDERIAWVSRVGAGSNNAGRSLSLDPQGNLWLGEYNNQRYWKLSSADGSILGGPFSVAGNTPYGSAVDRNGILWGASLGNTLLRLDTNNANPTAGNGGVQVLNHGAFGQDYGIALGNNKVYQASLNNRNFIQYDPATGQFSNPGYPARQVYSTGIAADSQGNIFTGRSNNGIVKWSPSGAVLCENVAQPGYQSQHGVIVDSNNDVWTISFGNVISKFRGSDCAHLGVFPVGQGAYTYSDATGITAFSNTISSGKWSVIQDGGTAGTKWGTVTWNTEQQGNEPAGSSIVVAVRTADTQVGLGAANFVPVTNSNRFNMVGRFIEVQATLNANAANQSPVLSDITIAKGQSATTTTLSSNTATTYGNSITLTANVASDGGTPDGSVEFFEGGNSLGTASVVNGIATKTISSLNAGTYPISANYGGSNDFLDSSANNTHVVNKATPVITVTGGTFTYDGQPHGSTGTIAGIPGENLGSPTITYNGSSNVPVNAGTYTVEGSFAGNSNYNPANGSNTIVINKATPTVTVTGGTFAYDGQSHGSTGTVTGVGNEDLGAPSITYNGLNNAPSDAGTYNVVGSFAGNSNYESASRTNTITINKAVPTVSVTGGTFTYDGQSHSASGTVTGIGGADLGAVTITYNGSSDAPVNAGSYNVLGSFAGSNNYEATTGSNTITINKATPVITVTGGTFTYDGQPHGSTGTVTGIPGESLGSPTITYNGSSSVPVNAGTYNVVGSFAGNNNYESATGSNTIVINKADSAINVVGGTFTYDTQPHPATGSVTGVGGANVGTPTFTYNGSSVVPVNVGTYNVVGTFGGNQNYNPTSGIAVITINPAPSVITVSAPAFIAQGGNATLTGVLTGVANSPLGGRNVTLSIGTGAATQSCTTTTLATGAASCTITGINQPLGPNLPVASAFGGDSNYLPSSGSSTTLVFAYAATGGGSFVIGDLNSTVGQNVTFWGSQWADVNSLSGGAAPNDFKGFANRSTTTPVSCGATWTTDPGNNSNPPSSVPEYMAVIVSSSITKSGSTISGNTPKVVIVRTNTGYSPNLGNAGTGTVVGVLCP